MSQADRKRSVDNLEHADDEKPTTERNTTEDAPDAIKPNPPRTTTGGWFTTPKFGSAGSGGAELEPGSERD